MQRTKNLMREQVTNLYEILTSTFMVPVFEDEIAEDEETLLISDYHCFVYETGDMVKMDDMKSINQRLTLYYYSENRNDLDERTIDIVAATKGIKGVTFRSTEKQRLQKKDTDSYVDRIILTYNRRVIVDC